MHKEVYEFVEQTRTLFPKKFSGGKILEIGSLVINGAVRHYFERPQYYLGIDLGPGKGVDMVCHAADLPTSFNNEMDVVISTEALEHDRRYIDTLARIPDLLKPKGLLIITCAGPGRGEHGTHATAPADSPHTADHYGNLTTQDLSMHLKVDKNFCTYSLGESRGNLDINFWGIHR